MIGSPAVLLGGALAALLAVAGAGIGGFNHGRDYERAKVQLEALQALQAARDKEREWRDAHDKAQANYTAAQEQLRLAESGLRSLRGRLRDATATADQLSRAAPDAVRGYAAGADSDLARCTAELERFAAEAAGAAASARALAAGYPSEGGK